MSSSVQKRQTKTPLMGHNEINPDHQQLIDDQERGYTSHPPMDIQPNAR